MVFTVLNKGWLHSSYNGTFHVLFVWMPYDYMYFFFIHIFYHQFVEKDNEQTRIKQNNVGTDNDVSVLLNLIKKISNLFLDVWVQGKLLYDMIFSNFLAIY